MFTFANNRGIPILDMLSHGQEGLLDICCVLGGCLKEGNIQLIREFLKTTFNICKTECQGIYLCHSVFDDLLARQI